MSLAPYAVDCGICGGAGGHEVRDRRSADGWEDCPSCVPEVDCDLCGTVVDCRDRRPDVLMRNGQPQTVCRKCFALEPPEVQR